VGFYSPAHVGLALRKSDGVLHFMHASSPSNYGRVIVDDELSKYLYRYRSDSGSSSPDRCDRSIVLVSRLILRRPIDKIGHHAMTIPKLCHYRSRSGLQQRLFRLAKLRFAVAIFPTSRTPQGVVRTRSPAR